MTHAAADATMEAKDRGLSDGWAFTLGTLAGAAEIITEKVSLETLLDKSALGKEGFVRYVAKNVLAEGSEEAASDLINWSADLIYEALARTGLSEWETMIREIQAENPGMSRETAIGIAFGRRCEELGLDALGGALSGGLMAMGSGGKTLMQNRWNAARSGTGGDPYAYEDIPLIEEKTPREKQAETRLIYESLGLEQSGMQNAAPEEAAESIRAGQVTLIQHPYSGEVPKQELIAPSVISVPDTSVQRANALINTAENTAAQGIGGFKTTLTRLYQQIFQRSSGIPVEGLAFHGKQYMVEIGNKVPGKVISDPNLSAEKLALLDILPQVVNHAEYVGSGKFIGDGKKTRPVVRYDYFEMPVKISGRGYIAKFDVEVLPFTNNYRTHQIVNVDLSSPGGSLVGPAPTASPGKSNPRNINIARQASAVNRSVGDSSDSDLNGEMSLSEIFPKQEENYYAVFGLEQPEQSSKSWTRSIEGDIVDPAEALESPRPHNWAEPVPRMKRPTQHGFEAFPENDMLKKYIQRVKPMAGYFDVAMHGQPDGVCFGTDQPSMTARELARVIQHDPAYDGGPIRLLCCNVGKPGLNGEYCFAEELANALGVEVLAPDDMLFIRSDGQFFYGANQTKLISFTPNRRRRLG